MYFLLVTVNMVVGTKCLQRLVLKNDLLCVEQSIKLQTPLFITSKVDGQTDCVLLVQLT